SLLLPSFFFNDTSTTAIYPLSLHDALPILLAALAVACTPATSVAPPVSAPGTVAAPSAPQPTVVLVSRGDPASLATKAFATNAGDRKSTRLNSSHVAISYAVFCLKKKKINK